MAIESDGINADSRLAVKFYKRPVKLEAESVIQGRPIYEEYDFIKILVPGDQLSEIDTYVNEGHKQRFPIQWANYVNRTGNEEGFSGTPINEWPLVSTSQAEELKALKFHTVESIANASDSQLQRIGMIAGMSFYAFRDRAKTFLDLAGKAAEVSNREEEFNQLRAEKAASDEKIAQLQAQMAELMASIPTKNKGGRPKKVVEKVVTQ